jgi:hypothetical protein
MAGDRPRAAIATVNLPMVTAKIRFRRLLIGSVAPLAFLPVNLRRRL